MICQTCGEFKPLERNGSCASCNALARKADRAKSPEPPGPIAKVSENQSKLLARYAKKKAPWIRGKKCAVYPNKPATDIHHMAGRIGYADEWARENSVPLLLDERFWLPVSREGHQKINDNPVWAWENQFSFKRVSDPIFRKQ